MTSEERLFAVAVGAIVRDAQKRRQVQIRISLPCLLVQLQGA
jgi:hypothetical protein